MMGKNHEAILSKAYSEACAVMKKRAVSFYQAFSRLPEERFLSVAALYAFCRFADDSVDQETPPKEQALHQLDDLEKHLRLLYEEDPDWDKAANPTGQARWWPAFAHTVKKWQIPPDGFLLQIEGQRRDADFREIQTVQDLVDYSRLVAGSVGIMLMKVLAGEGSDTDDPHFIKACSDLGVAMQITNILRDVGEDLRTRDRIYLPSELLEKHGVSPRELKELAVSPPDRDIAGYIPLGFISLFEELADLADDFYSACDPWLAHFQPDSRLPLIASALIYQSITDAIREADYNCFTRRCYTDDRTRSELILKAALKIRF